MKTKIIFLFLFIFLSVSVANGQFPVNLKGTFLLSGKVLNAEKDTIEFGQTDFLDNKGQMIKINDNGTFSKAFNVNGSQDIYLYANNDFIAFYVQPNDTINIEWDCKNFIKTFKVSSPSIVRNKELQLNFLLYNNFRKARLDLSKKLGTNRSSPDTLKYRWINEMYNQELSTILGENPTLTKNTEKFVNQVYYFYSKLLLSNRLLPRYPLISNDLKSNPKNSDLVKRFIPKPNYQKEFSDIKFYESPDFRNFLFDYIRFGGELFSSSRSSNIYTQKNDIAPFSPGLKDYYNGMANLNFYPIRDWYITKIIFNSFSNYTFEESETVLNDFLPKCKFQIFKDTLISYYSMVKKFKSNNPAPDFKLKDDNGKFVSLKDFKGKLVYIDFWGVGCAPCRSEIANYVPKLHEKYKQKDVVFINICIDADEKTWKKTLRETKLEGVNLIAEGWDKNPVCKDYNIAAIPHYILIDRDSRFVDSNMAGPSAIISGQNTVIDELLKLK